MSELNTAAREIMNRLRNTIDYRDYSIVMDALDEIPTIEETDKELEKLWAEFEDVPMNPDTECIDEEFLGFPRETYRDEIWHWFDKRYSKGVAYLLYGGSVDKASELSIAAYLKSKCFDCDKTTCRYNVRGECKFPLIYEKMPLSTGKGRGCLNYER